MRRNRLFLLCLAFLVLFLQQGAALHELGHAIEDINYSRHADQHPGGHHSDVCDRCAAYAPGGTSITPSAFHFSAVSPDPFIVQPDTLAFLHTGPLAAYRSRAPPLIPV